jgi:hypothetical protein
MHNGQGVSINGALVEKLVITVGWNFLPVIRRKSCQANLNFDLYLSHINSTFYETQIQFLISSTGVHKFQTPGSHVNKTLYGDT